MRSHDIADRTLPPTERRRFEFRARGQVPRSAELTAAAGLLATSCLWWFVAVPFTNTLATLMRKALTTPPPAGFDIAVARESIEFAVHSMAMLLWPILLSLVACGMAANVIQTGFLWVPSVLIPQFRQNSIFSWNRLTESLTRIVRLITLVAVTCRYLFIQLWQFRSIAAGDPFAMLSTTSRMSGELCLQLSLCLVLFALIDYAVRFWRHEQDLKMTIEERRREQRDEEISPQIKHRRAAAMARGESINSLESIERVAPTN